MKTLEFYKTKKRTLERVAYWKSLEQVYNLFEHANKHIDAWYCDGSPNNPQLPSIDYLKAVIESYGKVEVEFLQNGGREDLCIYKKNKIICK